MKRTKYGNKRMINYFDKGGAQRWGKVKKEHKSYFIVITALGELERVKKEKIIEEKWVNHIQWP